MAHKWKFPCVKHPGRPAFVRTNDAGDVCRECYLELIKFREIKSEQDFLNDGNIRDNFNSNCDCGSDA